MSYCVYYVLSVTFVVITSPLVVSLIVTQKAQPAHQLRYVGRTS